MKNNAYVIVTILLPIVNNLFGCLIGMKLADKKPQINQYEYLLNFPQLLMVLLCISGPVVMNISGFTERGFKRKLAVQALFGKIFYLSEVRGYILDNIIVHDAPFCEHIQ